MPPISVVIIAKNEENNIADCVASALQISNDVVVADTGSIDNTIEIAEKAGARVIQLQWLGYGLTRNKATEFAHNNWIFVADADERITKTLATTIHQLVLDEKLVYGCKRESFLMNKKVRFGEWGRDKVYRLYNKNHTKWDDVNVHENLETNHLQKRIITGSLLHYTMESMEEYYGKTEIYARLSAEKYLIKNKKSSWIKKYISPIFSFIQNYIFRLGFLDGKVGFIIAKESCKYVYLKYAYLQKLQPSKTSN